MAYEYKSPIERGYAKFKLSKRQHNELFPRRNLTWADKYEYYYNEKTIILHKFYSRKAVVLTTILFPVLVLFVGLSNIKEAWDDLIKMYNQKKSGSFVSDHFWHEEKKFEQVMSVIKKDKK